MSLRYLAAGRMPSRGGIQRRVAVCNVVYRIIRNGLESRKRARKSMRARRSECGITDQNAG